jgi:hypothetical protein
MKDGHLNICKGCVKNRVRKRLKTKMKSVEFLESERARHRDKYHRLNYKEKHKPSPEQKKKAINNYNAKFPEKIKAKHYTQHLIKKNPSNNMHHWSYNENHYKDVIELSVKDHNLIHRFIKYNSSFKMYEDLKGNLLDSKEKHEAYISNIILTKE